MRNPPPPSRYRIYERDRRLVVVDSWVEGRPDADMPGLAPRARRRAMPFGRLNRVAFDGRMRLTTHTLLDNKAPRTIVLDPGSAATIERLKLVAAVLIAILVFVAVTAPFALLALLALAQPRVRTRIRAAITAWFDRAGTEAI